MAGILSLLASFTGITIAAIRSGLPLPAQQSNGPAVRREFQHNVWILVCDLRGWLFRTQPLFEGYSYGLAELDAWSPALTYF